MAADGAEGLVLAMIISIVSKEWNLKEGFKELIISCLFCGVLVGSVITGQLSDKLGRKKASISSSLILTIFGILSIFSQNEWQFIFCRSMFGVGLGFVYPLTSTIVAETHALNVRGRAIGFTKLFYVFGEIIGVLCAEYTLKSLSAGNWRYLLACSSGTCLIASVFTFLFIRETARFLIFDGQIDKGIQELEFMLKSNNKNIVITDNQKQKIMEWGEQLSHQQSASFKELFVGHYKLITPLVWIAWFVTNFVYYGIIFTVPLTLLKTNMQSAEQNFNSMMILAIIQVPAVLISAFSVDIKGLGRKNSMAISFIIISILMISVYYLQTQYFIFMMAICKFFARLCFTYCYQYTSEIYGTKVRVTGIGIASAMSRISGIFLPFLSVIFTQNWPFLPYLIFGIFSLVAGIACFFLPYDTIGQMLDQIEVKNMEDKEQVQ